MGRHQKQDDLQRGLRLNGEGWWLWLQPKLPGTELGLVLLKGFILVLISLKSE